VKYLFFFISILMLFACQENPKIYSGDFEGLKYSDIKMRGWEIVLNGYLAKDDSLTRTLGGPVVLYETQEAYDRRREDDHEIGILISIDRHGDVSSCYGKYVTLVGVILAQDRGRAFVKASQLTHQREPTDAQSDQVQNRAPSPDLDSISCYR